MKKGEVDILILGVFLLILLSSGIFAAATAPNPGHSSEQVYVQVRNGYVTLQRAIDLPSLASVSSYDTLPTNIPYHLASQILVTKEGYTMTLQEALNNQVFKLGATRSYNTTLPAGGEYASSINISTTTGFMNLQNAINQDKLSHVWSCVENFGQSCFLSGDTSCVNSGTTQCDGSCPSTYKSRGANCNSDGWHTCDGAGHCQGWSSTGCGACPFGVTYQTAINHCNADSNYYSGWTSASGWNGIDSNYLPCAVGNSCNCGLSGCGICFSDLDWWIKPA